MTKTIPVCCYIFTVMLLVPASNVLQLTTNRRRLSCRPASDGTLAISTAVPLAVIATGMEGCDIHSP